MAIASSAGYSGPVSASEWAILNRYRGLTYSVLGHDHLVASKGTGDRGVKLSNGDAVGHGVLDVNSGTVVNLNADIMSSAGSRWDTLCLERDWTLGVSKFVILKGNASKVISSARLRQVGTGKDHQPLWALRIENGKTDIQEYVDLRVWQQDGGLHAADPMARGYMDGLGTDMLCKNGIRYIRVLDPTSGLPVWSEHRQAPYGERPYLMLARETVYGSDTPAGTVPIAHANTTSRTADWANYYSYVAGTAAAPAYIEVKRDGLYALNGRASFDSVHPLRCYLAFSGTFGRMTAATRGAAPAGNLINSISDTVFLKAGQRVGMSATTENSVRVANWYLWLNRISD